MIKVTIVGTTTWGTTLALMISREGINTTLLARTKAESSKLIQEGQNSRFLPGVMFPNNLSITHLPKSAFDSSSIAIYAVPSATFRTNVVETIHHIPKDTVIVSASKGLELNTGKRMTEILREVISDRHNERICALSGPNLASEIISGKLSSTVVASIDNTSAKLVQSILNSDKFRVYTNTDVVGVELAGALKNITAIAAGICDGLHLGNNAKATIITRGLSEMSRLGTSMGANPLTFAGLAGMGDIIATCSSNLSRNNRVGRLLATGASIPDIARSIGSVTEGIGTTKATIEIAERINVEMPLAKSVYNVLFNNVAALEAVRDFMVRAPRSET